MVSRLVREPAQSIISTRFIHYHFHRQWLQLACASNSSSYIFTSGGFIEYLFDREDIKAAWQEFAEHDFVRGLASGELPLERFKTFLIQDYLFLVRLEPSARFETASLHFLADTILTCACFSRVQG
jgi:hypothetical protein